VTTSTKTRGGGGWKEHECTSKIERKGKKNKGKKEEAGKRPTWYLVCEVRAKGRPYQQTTRKTRLGTEGAQEESEKEENKGLEKKAFKKKEEFVASTQGVDFKGLRRVIQARQPSWKVGPLSRRSDGQQKREKEPFHGWKNEKFAKTMIRNEGKRPNRGKRL